MDLLDTVSHAGVMLRALQQLANLGVKKRSA